MERLDQIERLANEALFVDVPDALEEGEERDSLKTKILSIKHQVDLMLATISLNS